MQLKVFSINPIGSTGRLIQFERPGDWSQQAGQYITLLLNISDKEIRRSYSLCSLPEEAPAIAVERVTNGLASRWLIDQLHEGDVLESLPPMGRFVLPVQLPPLLVFVVAGSGISAVLPLIRQALADSKTNIRLIYACKNLETAWFATELLQMQHNAIDHFFIHWFESQPIAGIPKRVGNIGLEILVKSWPQWHEAHYFLCGLFAFMRTVKITLGFMGLAETAIHQENFASEGQRFFTGKTVLDEAVTSEIRYQKGDKLTSWIAQKGDTVLNSAKKAGIVLEYSCENGFCGTCILRKKSGAVVHRINEVLTDAELATGWILSCTAYPTTIALRIEELT